MAKNDLLKEAIADAKAVRETALANAKIALEEAFTPRIQSMLSAKLSEEEGEEVAVEEPVAESEDGMEGESKTLDTLKEDEDEYVEEGEDVPVEEPAPEPAPEAPVEEEEDLELEAIIKELEDEMAVEEDLDATDIGNGDNQMDQAEADSDMESPTDLTEDEYTAGVDDGEAGESLEESEEEEVSIDEIIKALREDEGEEAPAEEPVAEQEEAEADLEEAYKVIRFLKSKINEVNLLNAKLLFSNKLFRNHSLNEAQKMKVIENFDRAHTLREVKLVFTTLSESFNIGSRTKRTIKESYASKPSRSTRPSKSVITEGNDLAARWKKLANL
jgi:flagellar biosynthesis/type III secretory pathway chaperone